MRERLAQGSIRLRRYQPGDGPSLYQAVHESIPELTRWGFYRVDYTPQQAAADVRSNIRQWDKRQAFAYVIEEGPFGAPEGAFVGQCRVEEIEYEHRNAALGWWVRTSCTGRGIATAAARLVAQAAFENLNLIRLNIYTNADNVASRRVAAKIGGVFEGILRSQRIGPSGPIDCAVYGLLPGELRVRERGRSMSASLAELEPTLRDLFAAQRYAVLGTLGAAGVSLNLMAIAASGNLRSLILATERATSKYANLRRTPQVSLLVDSRSNQSADTQTALALTIDGLAEEVSGAEREQLAARLLARHPQLESFVHSPTCALFRVRVQRYELVRGLYDVREASLG